MKRTSVLPVLLVVATVLLVLPASCGRPESTTAQQAERQQVMLYGSLKDSQLAAIREGFMEKYPNITMDYYTAGTGNVMTKLATEQQAGGIAADLIWVGDPTHYEQFKQQGLLLEYDSPAAAAIPDEFKDPDRHYISARLIMLGFVYNTAMLTREQAPKRWEDLLRPEFNDYVAMTDPTTSGTTMFTVAGLVQNPRYGWDYLRKLKANNTKLERGSTGVVNSVASGEYMVSVGVDYIAREIQAQGAPIAFIYPDTDIPLIQSPIAIIRNTRNPEAAKLLYDYIISEEGQKVLVDEFTMPINPNMVLGDGWLSPVDAGRRMLAVDEARLAVERDDIVSRFDDIFK
jgi:iron(III) transport system substrate-binding protein